MTGPLVQMVALTCHGNAFLRGHAVPELLRDNSAFQFCDSVKFLKLRKTLLGKTTEEVLAGNPNAWLEMLKAEAAVTIRLHHRARNETLPDRLLAGLAGGGPLWAIETTDKNSKTARWLSDWSVWNRDAPEQRIWRVSYVRAAAKGVSTKAENLTGMTERLRAACTETEHFARAQNLPNFVGRFSCALKTLNSGG